MIGVTLGDPNSNSSVFINGVARVSILQAEALSFTAPKLAVNLLTSLFTHEELASGNCTKAIRDDISLLDPIKLQGIRGIIICSL